MTPKKLLLSKYGIYLVVLYFVGFVSTTYISGYGIIKYFIFLKNDLCFP